MSVSENPVKLSGMPDKWCEPCGDGHYRLLDVDSCAGSRIAKNIADEELEDDPDFRKFSWIRECLIHAMDNCRVCFVRYVGDSSDKKSDIVKLDRVGDIDLTSVFGDFLDRVRAVSGEKDTKSVVIALVNSLYGSVSRVVGLYLRLLECAGVSLGAETFSEGSYVSFMSSALARLLIRDYGFKSHNKIIRLLAVRFHAGFPDGCGVRVLEVPEVDTVVDSCGILTIWSVPCGGRKLANPGVGACESLNEFLDTVVVECEKRDMGSDFGMVVNDVNIGAVEPRGDDSDVLNRAVIADDVSCDGSGQSRDIVREKLVSGVRRNIRESRKNGNFMKSLDNDVGDGSVQSRVFMASGGSASDSVNFNKSRMPVVADEGDIGGESGNMSDARVSDLGSGGSGSDEHAVRIDAAIKSLKKTEKKTVKSDTGVDVRDTDDGCDGDAGGIVESVNTGASMVGVCSSRIDGHLYGRVFLRYLSVPYRVSRFIDVDLTDAFDRIVAVNSWDESLRQYCRRKVSVDASSDLWVVSRIVEGGGLDVMRGHIGKEMASMSLVLIPELAADVQACGFRFDYLLSRLEMCVSVNDLRCFLSSRKGFNNSVGALFDYLVRDVGTHV